MKAPKSSAPPFPLVNPAQTRRPRRQYSLLRSVPEFTTDKGFGEVFRRFMNSPW